jgi:hypothetical protein
MTINLLFRNLSLATALLALNGALRVAQSQALGNPSVAENRAQLTAEISNYEQLGRSTAYGTRTRVEALRRAAVLRDRLQRGDFQEGDRFLVRVSGSVTVVDTVTVLNGQSATIPGFSALSLAGVLRSELEETVRRHVVASVLDATVTTRVLVRVAVFGSVTSPGYQVVPAETRLDELLTGAGGPLASADPSRFALMRGSEVLLRDAEFLRAIGAGATVASLGLREGDFLAVTDRPPSFDSTIAIQIFTVIAGPILAVLLTR